MMLGASMPEAAVYEHGEPTRGERDVRPDRPSRVWANREVHAEPQPNSAQRLAQR